MKKRILIFSVILNLILIVLLLFFVKKSGGWNFLLYKLKTNPIAGTYEHKKNLFDVLKIDSSDIVFLGNSLTEQGKWDELFDKKGIKNRGIGGDVTEGILKRLSPILTPQPSKIFLMIGVNDLLFHSPDKTLEFYKLIVEKIQSKSPQTKLYLQSLLPVNQQVKSIPILNSDIKKLNLGIKEIARKKDLTFIDLFSKFLDEEGRLDAKYTKDGIHLDAAGYLLWKSEIEDFVFE